ncbi:MAG: 6-carboxytetrahydropterin synthase QueD [Coriobacteriaceae bacterium]|jgi:queuosine biosynthesis protein QueD|nr:6-carboxytetrahydropterin synthase QueD [Coriobacteriaceae bacterium]
MHEATLNTDGGSRGNPGMAGLGFTLVSAAGETLAAGGWCLAQASNNVAEYSALVWGLQNALAAQVSSLEVLVDSELIARQMKGEYRVKSEDLKPLYMRAKALFARFSQVSISHVYRAHNEQADRYANEAMDARAPVGPYLVVWEESPVQLFERPELHTMGGLDAAPAALAQGESLPAKASKPDAMDPRDEGKADIMEKNKPYVGPCRLSGQGFEYRGGHYQLSLRDHFDAAHTLVGYDGPCRYLHGHTWDVEATIAGEFLDQVGMLYDFKTLKRDLHAVLENFDHRYVNDVPPFDVINPTAENLARVIFCELEKTLPDKVYLQEVAVWESPQAKVTYRP